jgi:hypothetical protein
MHVHPKRSNHHPERQSHPTRTTVSTPTQTLADPTTKGKTQYAALAVNQSTRPADLVAFSHATLFSPPIKTLAEALRKEFIIGFPGLTKESLAKYPPQSMATIKGHLDQSRKNQKRKKSTQKQKQPNVSDPNNTINAQEHEEEQDSSPPSDTPNLRSHFCYAAIIDITGQIYTDQTGRFPIPSS